MPLLDNGTVTGALVLMRDVSDLRRRDRLLLSKDAAIREVHHRVKNNLQTISSLLRLQSRRMPTGQPRSALEEAERRVRSIAVVHEILSAGHRRRGRLQRHPARRWSAWPRTSGATTGRCASPTGARPASCTPRSPPRWRW